MKFTQELKDKWLAALRSGEYKQCRHHLKDIGGGYCCLGVLADVFGGSFDERGFLVFEGIETLNSALLRGEGDDSLVDGLSIDEQRELARRNDSDDSFADIAKHIEQNIPAVA